ncbi:MAG: hypothetical protein DMF19_03925 [Verrucomicrobia bacterium]|nr:MAG: hypothetical protein DMF19_03925 [Verrucomicrobiota bacterium]
MGKSSSDPLSGYKISEGPVTSSLLPQRDVEELTGLPAHYGKPLLVAIARDPQTLFICWSVDWPAAFAKGLPADRCAHVRIRQNGNEKTVAVEPMSGSCAIEELEPGETYSVELGYYAPPETWNSVVTGNEVVMPFTSESADQMIDVATVPFHLTFQRILDAFRGSNGDELAQTLAKFQERANQSELSRDEAEVMRALDLSPEDLQKTAATRESLAKSERLRERGEKLFGGASPGKGFGGSS